MANALVKFRAELSERSLSDLRFMRDAGDVTGHERLAVLAAVIREKEESAEAEQLRRQDELSTRSVSAAEQAATAAGRSMIATISAVFVAVVAVFVREDAGMVAIRFG